MDRATADKLATAAEELADRLRPFFAGQDPGVQGAVITQLLAIFVAGHHPAIRYEQLDLVIDATRRMVPLEIEVMIEAGRCPPDWRDGSGEGGEPN